MEKCFRWALLLLAGLIVLSSVFVFDTKPEIQSPLPVGRRAVRVQSREKHSEERLLPTTGRRLSGIRLRGQIAGLPVLPLVMLLFRRTKLRQISPVKMLSAHYTGHPHHAPPCV